MADIKLLIDLGNTRMKWVWARGGEILADRYRLFRNIQAIPIPEDHHLLHLTLFDQLLNILIQLAIMLPVMGDRAEPDHIHT